MNSALLDVYPPRLGRQPNHPCLHHQPDDLHPRLVVFSISIYCFADEFVVQRHPGSFSQLTMFESTNMFEL